MTGSPKPLRPLDRTWWQRTRGGYQQQDGRARIHRILANGRPVRWELWVDGTYRGSWTLFGQAKDGAASIPQAELEVAPATPGPENATADGAT